MSSAARSPRIRFNIYLHSSARLTPPISRRTAIPTGPGSNGFSQVPALVQQSQPILYNTAIAQATAGSGIGLFPVVDMTSKTSFTIDIVDSPSGAACTPACFAITDPKTGQQVISPNVKVKVGTKITWVNKSSTTHTVTSIVGEESRERGTGQNLRFWYCNRHRPQCNVFLYGRGECLYLQQQPYCRLLLPVSPRYGCCAYRHSVMLTAFPTG